jgi:ATP-dependent DNA helicase RecG
MINNMKSAQLPEPEFKEEMGGFSVRFYKDIYTEESLRKMDLNERQIKAVLYIKERGKITNREYQEINNCSRNTARNDLRDLIRKGILKESGKRGAGAYYEIA